MTDREILIKALDKALCNRYHFPYHDILDGCSWDKHHADSYIENMVLCNGAPIEEMHQEVAIRDIIFSHEFAKAFWGEEIIRCGSENFDDTVFEGEVWELHLQQMVLEENPLKYLEKFLND